MASVHIAEYVDMTYMFNISAGVGRSRPNHRLDVMLIQWLLNHARNQTLVASGSESSFIRPPGAAALAIDGICGANTQQFIDYYQTFRNSKQTYSGGNKTPISMTVKADGAIDPWTYPASLNITPALAGSPVNRTYTLVTLSYDVAKELGFRALNTMPLELRRVLCAH